MQEQITIAVDAMGSDTAPATEVAGAVLACRQWGISVILVGIEEQIRAELAKHATEGLRIQVKHASEIVGMHDAASDALRKKDSSIWVSFSLVKDGVAQAVVSAGNSGATMAAGMFVLKRVKGIERPAIATVMPNLTGRTLVLDAGANVDCKPVHLEQFAFMGHTYARHVLGLVSPRVGLLSNGEEEKKGTDLTRETHALLKQRHFNYVGYVEGRDIFNGKVDVVVCDGFVGNVVLKLSEGLAEAISLMLRREIEGRWLSKIGYLLARPSFKAFKKKVDYAEFGGAPLLGINGTGLICHGGSSSKAIANAIRLARDYASSRVSEKLASMLVEEGVADT